MSAPVRSDDPVTMGRVAGLYGVRGWVKVYSHTRDKADLLHYPRWLLKTAEGWREYEVSESRVHGAGLVARLAGFEDRDHAAPLVGMDIAVRRSELPELPAGEYYWAQLQGLRVLNEEGVDLGRLSHLFETGANDVMVVIGERERLVPFIRSVVKKVDLAAGEIRVDWDADF